MKLNHNLVLTRDADAMIHFWTDVIGLTIGERPPFPFKGAWLYSEGKPLIHIAEQPDLNPYGGALAHVALEGAAYQELISNLIKTATDYSEKNVPVSGERQVFVKGPDGLVVEMQFPLSETVNTSNDTRDKNYEYSKTENYDYLGTSEGGTVK